MKNRRDINDNRDVNSKKAAVPRKSVVCRQEFTIGLTVFMVIGILILCFILLNGMHTKASPAGTSYKYYTNIRVEKGDTLWNIAEIYMTEEYPDINTYIKEVCSINHIREDDIRCGQYITVPYYSGEYLH